MSVWKSPVVVHQGIAVEPDRLPNKAPKKAHSRLWWIAGAVLVGMCFLAWRMSARDETTARVDMPAPKALATPDRPPHGSRANVFGKMLLAGMELHPAEKPPGTFVVNGVAGGFRLTESDGVIRESFAAFEIDQPDPARAIAACSHFTAAVTGADATETTKDLSGAIRQVANYAKNGRTFEGVGLFSNGCRVTVMNTGLIVTIETTVKK